MTGDPIPVAGGKSMNTRVTLGESEARAGTLILGWKRLVGVHAEGRDWPVVEPLMFGDLVGAEVPFRSYFELMTSLWYGPEEESDENPLHSNVHQMDRLVWGSLQSLSI